MRVWERGVGETFRAGPARARPPRWRTAAGWSGPRDRARAGRRATVGLGETIRLGGPVAHVFDVEVDLDASAGRGAVSRRDTGIARQRRRLTATEVDLEVVQQRALLVGTGFGTRNVEEAEASLDELALLTDTAGADPVDVELQRRDRPDPATYIGKGKAEELRELAEALDVDVVVFDDELSPAQQRNLEKLFERDVVDRVALILDIFAQHATSQEGMVQVELAQLRYRLPAPAWPRLAAEPAGVRASAPAVRARPSSRSTAGASCAASRSSSATSKQLAPHPRDAAQGSARRASRGSRSSATRTRGSRRCSTGSRTPTCSSRTGCSRRSTPPPAGCVCPAARRCCCSDTVGFVRRLPHQLVEAFRSTLEEVADADLLLHVVDAASRPTPTRRSPRCTPCCRDRRRRRPRAARREQGRPRSGPTPSTSCRGRTGVGRGVGVQRAKASTSSSSVIADRLRALDRVVELVVPYDRGDVLAALHRDGEVLVEVHDDDGTRVRARLPDRDLHRLAAFIVEPTG